MEKNRCGEPMPAQATTRSPLSQLASSAGNGGRAQHRSVEAIAHPFGDAVAGARYRLVDDHGVRQLELEVEGAPAAGRPG